MTTDREKDNVTESGSQVSKSPLNEADTTATREPLVQETKQSGLAESITDQVAASSLIRKSGGPKTPSGKERSKRNAIKHGIFSKAVLRRSESRSEFDALLKGLMEQHQPVGANEEQLVDILAAIRWRQRRLLIAETAGIEMASFVEWDEKERQEREAWETFRSPLGFSDSNGEYMGLMQKSENPIVLDRSLVLLNTLKLRIETNGFDPEFDEEILTKVYGHREHWAQTLLDAYRLWSSIAKCSDQEAGQNGNVPVEDCKHAFLESLKRELKRLNRFRTVRASVESRKRKLEAQRRYVPHAAQLDTLLRYGAALERAYEKTLAQLERLQQIRLGQAVLPPIKVSLTR